MAKKVTLKSIKDMVKAGVAEDISKLKRSDVGETLTTVAYSMPRNSNSSNGVLKVRDKTKKLYAAFDSGASYWK